jgi:hypothetical protein
LWYASITWLIDCHPDVLAGESGHHVSYRVKPCVSPRERRGGTLRRFVRDSCFCRRARSFLRREIEFRIFSFLTIRSHSFK